MREYVPKGRFSIENRRYLELLNHCRQYPEWKRKYKACFGMQPPTPQGGRSSGVSDPVERAVERAEKYLQRMELIEQTAIQTSSVLYRYILRNVTEGTVYEKLVIQGAPPPCGRRQFYELRRKFFYLLSQNKKG